MVLVQVKEEMTEEVVVKEEMTEEVVEIAETTAEVVVEEERLGVLIDGNRRWLDLGGIFQVFRSETGTTWTILHLDGTVLTIPDDAITGEHLDYLKSFALRALRERKAAVAR